MNRRHFLTFTSAADASLPFTRLRGASQDADGPLAEHRITALETKSVPLPWPRHVGRNAKRDVHDPTDISGIERGLRNPGIVNVARLAKALGLTTAQLCKGADA